MSKNAFKLLFGSLIFIICLGIIIFGQQKFQNTENITHKMTVFILQLGLIIFSAAAGHYLFKKIKMPSVLGELAAGIIIGPYLLGGIGLGLPGLEQGLFGVQTNSLLSVSTELYGIATIASILLLFMAGLETDIDLFFQFSIAGLIIGIGGVLFSFLFGTLTGIYFCNLPFSDPRCLFLGVISAATSVGITTRILSEKKKLESPEGVTIMAGAVIDDVLSIIMLAIVLGFSLSIKHTGVAVIDWNEIYAITLKSIIVCAGFTALGIMYSSKISKALKTIKNHTVYSVMAFGMALLLASVFEQTGLAMIIGAYIMGLTLSKTDLHYELQERLAPLYGFFVPIFFTVMGMLINVRLMFDKDILILGLVFSAGAVLAKIIGCGLPSFFLKFNALGALRIGLGMVPRGEVALIVAGIGLSYGIIDEKIFGVSIMMTFLTTIASPPFLNMLLTDKKGSIKKIRKVEKVVLKYNYPSETIADIFLNQILETFRKEGFFIYRLEIECVLYKIIKNDVSISLFRYPDTFSFSVNQEDVQLVKVVLYESNAIINAALNKIAKVEQPENINNILVYQGGKNVLNYKKLLSPENIIIRLKGNSKREIISELVNCLHKNNRIFDEKVVLEDVMERENSGSTGMQNGIAIPHARTLGAHISSIAIGVKREGIDFQSLDGLPSKIFILIVAPKGSDGSYLQILSGLSSFLSDEKNIDKILKSKKIDNVFELFAL